MTGALRRLLPAALFGAVDGLVVILGVLLPLHTQPHPLILAGTGAAIAEAVGMAAGSWLSQDNQAGWREAATIGAATGAASLAPITPYLTLPPSAALAAAAAIVAAQAGLVAVARWRWQHRSLPRALAETFGILTVVACCVAACALLLGGT